MHGAAQTLGNVECFCRSHRDNMVWVREVRKQLGRNFTGQQQDLKEDTSEALFLLLGLQRCKLLDVLDDVRRLLAPFVICIHKSVIHVAILRNDVRRW